MATLRQTATTGRKRRRRRSGRALLEILWTEREIRGWGNGRSCVPSVFQGCVERHHPL
jgi:hypothetical protein